MKYQEWLNGCGCSNIQDCPPSTGNPCDCDSILLELSKQHTDDLVLQDEIDALSGVVEDKQDKLTAGTGIDITDNVISVIGGGESSGITSGEVQTMIDKSISGKADADDVYKKTETSSKTEIDDALLLDAYEDYKTKNTYTGAFPSLSGTADWNTAIQGGIYAKHSTWWEDDSYQMSFKLQVVDENGNTFSAATRNITERSFTVDNVNPLPDYIDVVRPTYEESYYSKALASWIFKPKDGYRISYAEINSYWEDDFTRHNNITEIEFYDAFPSGYTKDIIENYIEPKLANAQEKLSFESNVKLNSSEGKLVPYVPTDYNISDWYSASTNPVQTQAVYKYTYSKAETDALLNEKVNVVDNEVPEYNVTNEITYQDGYPSQTETASTWADASMFTLRYNFFKLSDTNYTTTVAVIDPSGNITTGNVTTDEYRIGNPLPDYIDMIREGDDISGKYYFTAKEGYRIAHLDIYSSRYGRYGAIIEESVETVFEGGQSADVIKNVIEPELLKKQDTLSSGENIKTINNISILGSGNIDAQSLTDVPVYSGSALASVSINNPSGLDNGYNRISGATSVGAGYMVETRNVDEAAFGIYNLSNGENSEVFDYSSGSTLFSVGNGHPHTTGGYIRKHNAFEIRQNGDIYYTDTNAETEYPYEQPMIKLQDVIKNLQNEINSLKAQINGN